ncbi:hypothetical protein HD554DRAFT_2246643, partial [Boletus coccyginus]
SYPPKNGISPPTVYSLSAAVYNLSAGELSSNGLTSGRHSRGSGTHSPSLVHSIPYTSVPCSHHFSPVATPTTHSAAKPLRRKAHNGDLDEDDDDFQPVITSGNTTDVRCETICHQHIKSEQHHPGPQRHAALLVTLAFMDYYYRDDSHDWNTCLDHRLHS